MKINKIASALKKDRILSVYSDKKANEKWIGNGSAIYRLGNAAGLTAETALKFFGVAGDAINDWELADKEMDAETSKLIVDADLEAQETSVCFTVEHKFENINFFKYDGGFISVKEKYVLPAHNGVYKQMEVRKRDDGTPFLAVKDGLILIAVIMPVMLERDVLFVKPLKDLSDFYSKHKHNGE